MPQNALKTPHLMTKNDTEIDLLSQSRIICILFIAVDFLALKNTRACCLAYNVHGVFKV